MGFERLYSLQNAKRYVTGLALCKAQGFRSRLPRLAPLINAVCLNAFSASKRIALDEGDAGKRRSWHKHCP
jgi:hypothetical protein